jgi:hypothetical protein
MTSSQAAITVSNCAFAIIVIRAGIGQMALACMDECVFAFEMMLLCGARCRRSFDNAHGRDSGTFHLFGGHLNWYHHNLGCFHF